MATPGVKESGGESAISNKQTQYRAAAARCNSLAQDRPYLQFAAKEICRSMSNPEENDWTELKRVGRYLKGEPRLIQAFRFQTMPSIIDAFADSDFAGCINTRKSTSGGAIIFGSHCIQSWSSTQSVIALSSGEAEYYSLVNTASQSIGIRNMLLDIGFEIRINLHTDSSTAKSISLRRGVGTIRHIETNQLWLQDKVKSGDIKIRKVGTHDNVAYLFTKHLSRDVIDKHLKQLGFVRQEGRHDLAPQSDYTQNHDDENQHVNHDNQEKAKRVRWADQEEDDNEENDPWQSYGISSVSSISKDDLYCATRSRWKTKFDEDISRPSTDHLYHLTTIKPREEHERHPRNIKPISRTRWRRSPTSEINAIKLPVCQQLEVAAVKGECRNIRHSPIDMNAHDPLGICLLEQ